MNVKKLRGLIFGLLLSFIFSHPPVLAAEFRYALLHPPKLDKAITLESRLFESPKIAIVLFNIYPAPGLLEQPKIPSPKLSAEKINEAFFGGANSNSIAEIYQWYYDGAFSISGKVYGWYDIPVNVKAFPDNKAKLENKFGVERLAASIEALNILGKVKEKIKAIDFSQYDKVVGLINNGTEIDPATLSFIDYDDQRLYEGIRPLYTEYADTIYEVIKGINPTLVSRPLTTQEAQTEDPKGYQLAIKAGINQFINTAPETAAFLLLPSGNLPDQKIIFRDLWPSEYEYDRPVGGIKNLTQNTVRQPFELKVGVWGKKADIVQVGVLNLGQEINLVDGVQSGGAVVFSKTLSGLAAGSYKMRLFAYSDPRHKGQFELPWDKVVDQLNIKGPTISITNPTKQQSLTGIIPIKVRIKQ